MKSESPKKTEIFLFLALRHSAKINTFSDFEENEKSNIFIDEFADCLSAAEAKRFRYFALDYDSKSDEEKEIWRGEIKNHIERDEPFLDENIHPSHIYSALQKEIPAVQEIIRTFLPFAQLKKDKKDNLETDVGKRRSMWIERTVRTAFAKQFVSQKILVNIGNFDRLSGTQLARLVRFAGLREVALACARIDAVESVTAFLRRFAEDDARAIATQINSLTQVSLERSSFAENLVQTALEIEPQPSAMLNLLGIWLTGILLCGKDEKKVAYAAQRFPLEIATKLAEIIKTQDRQTPENLQNEISAEIEKLAGTIISTDSKKT